MRRRIGQLVVVGLIVVSGLLVWQLVAPAMAQQAGEAQQSQEVTKAIPLPWQFWIAPAAAVLALLAAWGFYAMVTKADPGDERMQEIAKAVRDGAFAYLKRQYWVVGIVFLLLVVLLALQSFVAKAQHGLVPFAFLTGGFFSGLAGFFGMNTATKASNRTAQGATQSLNRALQVAFRAGAVMGLVVVGLGLLDITLWFLALTQLAPKMGYHMSLDTITVVMLTFGMGASTQALFARVGGGIFTKAADVGADLVGKVEAGIPEDDPRNPATIADNVGDNVGDVAGMGADLYESYCGSILATAALGAAAATTLFAGKANLFQEKIMFIVAPMVLAGVGILLSILSIFFVRTKEGASQKNLLWALRRGVWGSSLLILVAAAVILVNMLPARMTIGETTLNVAWGVFGAVASGLLAGVLIGWFTEYYTSAEYSPTKKLSDQALTGPATTIIGGIAGGMTSTWAPLFIISVATICAYGFSGGFSEPALGLYGIGIAAVGMLATLGVTLATDAYGPIADNAGGNAEMSHKPKEVRERTDALDSLGNTTAATGKGFAIGSAALTALALLAAYVEEVRVGVQREAGNAPVVAAANIAPGVDANDAIIAIGHRKYSDATGTKDPESNLRRAYIEVANSKTTLPLITATGQVVTEDGQPVSVPVVQVKDASLANFMDFYEVNLMNPKVLVGMFAGVLLVMVFCGMTMKAVGRAAGSMVDEVRRQFREYPGIMDGKQKPDYATCVSIATAGAQREMIVPALLAVAAPVVVGLLLNVAGVIGLLAGGLTAGFAVAIFMANAGGSWDNAKKFIESGAHGGKGSNPHKAAVVGDTVGDPFKDTSGPSLNILIKLMSMVSVVFAGLTVKYAPMIGDLFSNLLGK